MDIKVEIVNTLKEIEVIIKTPIVDDAVNRIVEKLSEEKPKIITGHYEDKIVVISEDDITRIYSSNKRVYVVCGNKEYVIKMPLYEVYERINNNNFIRISNTEIVNIKKIKEFDLSITGTIRIKLTNGDISYVSRRYVTYIKKSLCIGGKSK